MSYVNADDVLPKILVEEIQKYVDGQLIYIPRKNENSLSWGEKNGTKEKLAERNQTIVKRYYSGQTITELSEVYYLSEKRIQGIIHEYEANHKSMMEELLVKKADKYKDLFNKEYLMGPNSVRLLEEMLEKYPLERGMRVLDLGCGKGLTSLFLAREADVNVFATDLWISATENNIHFNEWQVSEKVIPIHADANGLPFAEEYFDAIVSIDSFHYVGTQPYFFEQKILPLLKTNGVAMIAMPGLKEEIHGNEPEVILEWLDGEENEYNLFHSRKWWLNHIGQSDKFEVVMDFDLESFDAAWNDWFLSKHEFALHDEKFFKKGIGQYLSIVGLVIRKV